MHYVIFIFINFCLLLSFIIYFIYSLISLFKIQINFLREIICEKMPAIYHILRHFPLPRTINFHQSVTSFFILRIDLESHVNNVLDMHIFFVEEELVKNSVSVNYEIDLCFPQMRFR